jgi:hypothetical protein
MTAPITLGCALFVLHAAGSLSFPNAQMGTERDIAQAVRLNSTRWPRSAWR